MSTILQLAGNAGRKVGWHTKQPAFVCNKRLVFEASLNSTIRLVWSQAPIEFILHTIDEPTVAEHQIESAEETISPRERGAMLLKGFASGREVFHLQITDKIETVAALIPPGRVSDRPVFIYDCFTDPDYRGRGIYPAALTWLLKSLHGKGVDRAFLRTHPQNVSSIRGAVKAGFRLCGIMYHLSFFGFCPKPFGRTFKTNVGAE